MLYPLIATIGHSSDLEAEWILCNGFHGCTGFRVPNNINIPVFNRITCTKAIFSSLFPLLNYYCVND